MRLEGNKIVLGMEPCLCSMPPFVKPGFVAGRKNCPKCKGTRRGPRGGRGGCRECFNGKVADFDNPVQCPRCEGTKEVEETYCSRPSEDIVRQILENREIRVFFAQRGMSFNESYLGLGLIGGCTDYGRTWKELESRSQEVIDTFIKKVYEEIVRRSNQVCHITKSKNDLTLFHHAVIIVNPDGYSVRPSFTDDSTDVLKQANGEPSVAAGTMLGMHVCNNGGHGVIAAATGKY